MKNISVCLLFLYTAASLLSDTPEYRRSSHIITVQGYDSHIHIAWREFPQAEKYAVYAAENDSLIGVTTECFFLHFPHDEDVHRYRIKAFDPQGKLLWGSPVVNARTSSLSDAELLDMVQRYTFGYFWDFAHETSGMIRERSDDDIPSKVTTGGSGMGVMALLCGVERGWISRSDAYGRIMKMLNFLSRVERFKGMWAHWYDGDTGRILAFSPHDDGGDVVESALMMQGLLCARAFFSEKKESPLRDAVTSLWEEMDWEFYTQGQNVIYWHYSPVYGFEMDMPIRGYNEALIVYILAASSPTHPIRADVYHEGWASWNQEEFSAYTEYYGIMLPLGNKRWLGGPLFFAHYSYLGLCPRGLRDRYAQYWQQNVRHTLINRAYCMDNPYDWKGYGAGLWGISACDMIPEGYMAHMPGYWFDRGTIAPTAAVSSIPYTPHYSMDVIRNLYGNHGEMCFGIYGFYDAVNFSTPYAPVRRNYIAIDQGPQVVMIENHRSGLLWRLFMSDEDVKRGLSALDFKIEPSATDTIPTVQNKTHRP